jgi:hypothetical protein
VLSCNQLAEVLTGQNGSSWEYQSPRQETISRWISVGRRVNGIFVFAGWLAGIRVLWYIHQISLLP